MGLADVETFLLHLKAHFYLVFDNNFLIIRCNPLWENNSSAVVESPGVLFLQVQWSTCCTDQRAGEQAGGGGGGGGVGGGVAGALPEVCLACLSPRNKCDQSYVGHV